MGYTDEILELEVETAAAESRLRVLRDKQRIEAFRQSQRDQATTLAKNIALAVTEIEQFKILADEKHTELDSAIIKRFETYGQNVAALGASNFVAKFSADYVNLRHAICFKEQALRQSQERLAIMKETERTHAAMQSKTVPERESTHDAA